MRRLVFVFARLMSRFLRLLLLLLLLLFLLLPFLGEREDVNALQTNAHSGAIPKSFSSSESSQLHGGACLGVAFAFAFLTTTEGTNANGETKCLRSVIVIVCCLLSIVCCLLYVVYYNGCIIIRIHIFLCFYLQVRIFWISWFWISWFWIS